MEFVDKEEVFAVMSYLSSLVGWNPFVMVITAVIGGWYFYDAFKRVVKDPTKLSESLRSFVLGLVWLSTWAIYNPRDFATIAPFLAKLVLVLGATGFVGSLVWSAMADFKLPWKKRTSKHSTVQTTS